MLSRSLNSGINNRLTNPTRGSRVNYKILFVSAAAVLTGGCATHIPPAIQDFTEDKVRVCSISDTNRRKSERELLPDSLRLAKEHCSTLDKDTTTISTVYRQWDDYSLEYCFLFRCEGEDRVVVVED